MKKIVLFAALIFVGATLMTSCGKSTKGKMANTWTIAVENRTTESAAQIDEYNLVGTDLTLSTTTGGTSDASTGIVSIATLTIAKEGTWEREVSTTFTEGLGAAEVITIVSEKSSGTWDFLSGVGDFKKNERVIFNTLSETHSTTITPNGGAATVIVTTDKYLEGESTAVYTITESKNKSLKMEQSFNNTSTDAGATSVISSSTKIELTAPKGK